MATRKRNYKKEYAARKRKAQQSGYQSVTEYRRARKTLRLPRNRPTPSKRVYQRFQTIQPTITSKSLQTLRRESRLWSDEHARVYHSTYRDDLTPEQVRKYHTAFVLDDYDGLKARTSDFKKRQRIKAYLVPDYLKDDTEWQANPSTIPLRR
jgi:hypothetical protein